jgi:hypothetical protein
MGEWRYNSIFIDLTPEWSTQGKSPQYTLNGKLGGTHRLYGRCGTERNILSLPGFEASPSFRYRSLFLLAHFPYFEKK